jgi:hypothetical protein
MSLEYWFLCIDLDCDGGVAASEMRYFYEEQLHRMECLSQVRRGSQRIHRRWAELTHLAATCCVSDTNTALPGRCHTGRAGANVAKPSRGAEEVLEEFCFERGAV